MNFTERLKYLLSEKNITWQQLSKELMIGKNQLKYWEEHDSLPTGKTLIKLSRFLGVSTDYLTGNTPTENAFNNVNGNGNIIGNGNTVGKTFTEQELALLRIFESLDVVKQAQLLACAAELVK